VADAAARRADTAHAGGWDRWWWWSEADGRPEDHRPEEDDGAQGRGPEVDGAEEDDRAQARGPQVHGPQEDDRAQGHRAQGDPEGDPQGHRTEERGPEGHRSEADDAPQEVGDGEGRLDVAALSDLS